MTGQNDRQDESLTGQALDQAGHCPLTGRYFEPWSGSINLSAFTKWDLEILSHFDFGDFWDWKG